MPYINQDARVKFDLLDDLTIPGSPGELNYVISSIINKYFLQAGKLNYTKINEVIGALECCKLEVYRRLASDLETFKCAVNGDVFDIQELTKGIK